MMTLNFALLNTEYTIESLQDQSDLDLTIRLRHLGFLENEKVKVLSKTPITGDSILSEIRGSQIALTKFEASHINLKKL